MSTTEKGIGVRQAAIETESQQRGSAPAQTRGLRGLTFTRVYSDPSVSPYDAIEWELRTAAVEYRP